MPKALEIVGWVTAAITLIWGLFAIIFDYILNYVHFLSLQVSLIILVLLIIVTVVLVGWWQKTKSNLEPSMSYLVVHSVEETVNSGEKVEINKYIVNNFVQTKQVLAIPNIITEKLIKKGKLEVKRHTSNEALSQFLKNNGITEIKNPKEATLYDLMLWIKPNRKIGVIEDVIVAEKLAQLKSLKEQGKMENKFALLFVYPKWKFLLYQLFRPLQGRDYPPCKRLIIVNRDGKKHAYSAPLEALQIVTERVIQMHTFFPWYPLDTIPHICKTRGIVFHEWDAFTIDRIIREAELPSEAKDSD